MQGCLLKSALHHPQRDSTSCVLHLQEILSGHYEEIIIGRVKRTHKISLLMRISTCSMWQFMYLHSDMIFVLEKLLDECLVVLVSKSNLATTRTCSPCLLLRNSHLLEVHVCCSCQEEQGNVALCIPGSTSFRAHLPVFWHPLRQKALSFKSCPSLFTTFWL